MSTSQELGTDKSETGTASTSQGANENNSVKDTVCEDEAGQINIKDHRGWRFWGSFAALSVSSLMSAFEATVKSIPTLSKTVPD